MRMKQDIHLLPLFKGVLLECEYITWNFLLLKWSLKILSITSVGSIDIILVSACTCVRN